jgi:uncharacterized protein (DUF924 family)
VSRKLHTVSLARVDFEQRARELEEQDYRLVAFDASSVSPMEMKLRRDMTPFGGDREAQKVVPFMNEAQDWRTVYDFWFPPALDNADLETHYRMFRWWFGGDANSGLPPFAPLVEAASTGRLDHWRVAPLGRLSLILVLDQFPRALFAGTRRAYAFDPDTLPIVEEGLRNGHYDALTKPWEKTFFFMPLAHTEGADHPERLKRAVALAEAVAVEVPECLRLLYRFSVSQARRHLGVISQFGRFPHRNAVLGRVSTSEERAYLEEGDFVHSRQPPYS